MPAIVSHSADMDEGFVGQRLGDPEPHLLPHRWPAWCEGSGGCVSKIDCRGGRNVERDRVVAPLVCMTAWQGVRIGRGWHGQGMVQATLPDVE